MSIKIIKILYFFSIVSLVNIGFQNGTAYASFRNSPEINRNIDAFATRFQSIAGATWESELQQNAHYNEWRSALVNLKNTVFESVHHSTCEIRVAQTLASDHILLDPELRDSAGNTRPFASLRLKLFKKKISESSLPGDHLFTCRQARERTECSTYKKVIYDVPQLEGVLNETTTPVNIYEGTLSETQMNPGATSDGNAELFRLTCDAPNQDIPGTIPGRCYFRKISENQALTRVVSAESGNCHLVQYMKGECHTYRPYNQLAGITNAPPSDIPFHMESVYATPEILSLTIDSNLGDGLYRFTHDGLLIQLDEELNPVAGVPPIGARMTHEDAPYSAALTYDSTKSLQQIADTFNFNEFLSSIDMGDRLFNAEFFHLLTHEASLRLKKVILSNQSWNRSLTASEDFIPWFPNLSAPPLIPELSAVTVGQTHSCAIVNGGARCWGYNGYGQLGNSSTQHSLIPVQVEGLTSGVTAIAAGRLHTCAIINGGAQCWGLNDYGPNNNGQLGNSSTENSLIPVQVAGLTSGVTAITGSCAIVNGGAQCWGPNDRGQLGNSSNDTSLIPVEVAGLRSGVTAIATGFYHTCAIVNGGAQCWGDNSLGQLGNNTTQNSFIPVQVAGLTVGVTAIATGFFHTCAIVNGAAQCWGQGHVGQLGNSSTENSLIPIQVAGLTSGVTAIAAGGRHTCAIINGGVQCWGSDNAPAFMREMRRQFMSEIRSSIPVQVAGLTSGVSAIAAGGYHSCAIVNKKIQCWGANGQGQLGNGNRSNEASLIPVTVAENPEISAANRTSEDPQVRAAQAAWDAETALDFARNATQDQSAAQIAAAEAVRRAQEITREAALKNRARFH